MKTKFISVIIILAMVSCSRETPDIINLNGNKITVMGHGGMGVSSSYPLNSYESIMKCLALGTGGSEFDVQMTKDSVLVLYHDQDLSSNTALAGLVNSHSWSEMKNARYRHAPYLEYEVCSLEELFAGISEPGKYKFTFDCKLYHAGNDQEAFNETYINAVISAVEKYGLQNNVCIESQSSEFLSLFKSKRPSYSFFIYPPDFESGLQIANSLGLKGITISTRSISREQVIIAHDNNLQVALWNVHSGSDHREAIDKQPDFIQSDRVEKLIKLLK
jgi:glycerophosphoryl diester phosphodiesterase